MTSFSEQYIFPFALSLQIFSYAHRVYAKTCKRQNNTEAKAFNFTFRYIDEVLSIDNPLDSINLSNKDLEIKTNQHKQLLTINKNADIVFSVHDAFLE
jgi:hypothetical protein